MDSLVTPSNKSYILQAAAEAKNKELRPWVPELIKHFWYCSRKAEGSEDAMLVSQILLLHQHF